MVSATTQERNRGCDGSGGHAGKIFVSHNGSGVLTLTQSEAGLAGNTMITGNLSNTTLTNFSGGADRVDGKLGLIV